MTPRILLTVEEKKEKRRVYRLTLKALETTRLYNAIPSVKEKRKDSAYLYNHSVLGTETRKVHNALPDVKLKRETYNKIKCDCECGKIYTKAHKTEHNNGLWHIKYMCSLDKIDPLPKFGTEEYDKYIIIKKLII